MAFDTWLALLGFFFIGGLTPGPAVMLVLGASARYGFRPAMVAGAGVATANVLWLALAAGGAAVLLARFPTLFSALKWMGLAVIVWLGVGQMRAPTDRLLRRVGDAPARAKLFGSGLALQLANPLALVTFALLIPGFFDAERPVLPQYGLMVLTITAMELNGLAAYALFGTWIRERMRSPRAARLFNIAVGFALVFAGAWAVLSTV